MYLQKEVNHKRQSEPFIGKTQFVNEIYEKIKSYLFGQNFSGPPDRKDPLCMAITAVLGQGKTHLVRTICDKLMKDQDFMKQNLLIHSTRSGVNSSMQKGSGNSKNFIYASSNNCDGRMKFLGAWRPILKNMMLQHAKNLDISRDEMLRRILAQNQDKVEILLEIFGIISGT